jgi:hypothetical protein
LWSQGKNIGILFWWLLGFWVLNVRLTNGLFMRVFYVSQCISSHTYYLMMVLHTQIFMIGFVTKFHYIHSKEVCAKVGVNCFHVPKTPSKSQQTLLPNLMLHSKILVPKLESVALMYQKKKHLQISTNSFTKSHVSFGHWGWSSWTTTKKLTTSSWWTQDDMIFFKTSKQQCNRVKNNIKKTWYENLKS